MIEIKHLSFSYGKRRILKDISLCFESGRFYAIIGPNGSGKTTLVNALAGLIRPSDGERWMNGKSYEQISRKDFARQLALLPQGRNVPDMSVFDLISCGRFPYLDVSRRLGEVDLKIVHKAMRETETEALANRNVGRLSGGERQRVYAAMLLAQDTPHVLLDEPTAHLDIACGFQIAGLLGRMRDEGKCVVAVLHDLPMALKCADEIIVLNHGEAVAMDAPKKIAESGCFESVFGVKCSCLMNEGRTVYCFDEME